MRKRQMIAGDVHSAEVGFELRHHHWNGSRAGCRRETKALYARTLLVGRDLMLRLVDRIPASGDRIVVLGESMLDRDQRRGVLTTVDLFPVRAVASGTSTSWPTLLGRAIAHEIGHLLLGTAEHPRVA